MNGNGGHHPHNGLPVPRVLAQADVISVILALPISEVSPQFRKRRTFLFDLDRNGTTATRGHTYSLNSAILAIHTVGGERTATMVPQGAVVTVQDVPPDGNRLVDVLWDGKLMMMFVNDLKERATLIS